MEALLGHGRKKRKHFCNSFFLKQYASGSVTGSNIDKDGLHYPWDLMELHFRMDLTD